MKSALISAKASRIAVARHRVPNYEKIYAAGFCGSGVRKSEKNERDLGGREQEVEKITEGGPGILQHGRGITQGVSSD